jgi:hypothetical protein
MTNVYALQNNVVFKPTDIMEMRQLFGLHMYMGCNKLPRLRMHWSLAMDLGKFQWTSTMSLRHFSQLRNNLHIANNLERPNDRLFKVRHILDCIRARCHQCWSSLNLSDYMVLPALKRKCDLKLSAVVFPRHNWPFTTVGWKRERYQMQKWQLQGKDQYVLHDVHLGRTGIKRPLQHSIQKNLKGPQNSFKRPLLRHFVW